MTLFPDRTIDGGLSAPPAVVVPRSAGRAWVLSLIAPGAGQLYCGASTRGIATLVLFFGALAALLLIPNDLRYIGLRMAMMLYAFAGLDAYATARELKHGIEADAPENPRVAAVLNLTTNGFGYVYLGWKIGFGTFFVLMLFWRSIGEVLPLLGEAVAIALAAHAYVGGRNSRRELYPQAYAGGSTGSRVPGALPWAVSGVVLGCYLLLVLVGQIMIFREFFS